MTQPIQDGAVGHRAPASPPAGVAAPFSGPKAAEPDPNQQLGFLYKALDDNQGIIRFLDAKAAFAVALLSAMIGKVLANLGDYFPRGGQPLWRQLLVLAFAFAAIWAAVLVALIIFPTTNPAANTRLISNTRALFFLSHLRPRRWQRIFSRSPKYSCLAQQHDEYLTEIAASNGLALLQVVSGEVLKLSYIRQIKTDRIRVLAVVLACCAVLFVLLMAADATLPKANKPPIVEIPRPFTLSPAPAPSPATTVSPKNTPTSQIPAPTAAPEKTGSH